MAERTAPYSAFNFVVYFDNGEEFGGFSDVSGIGTEVTVAEYRSGNDTENHVRKVPGINKTGDVTLKRGIVNLYSLWPWIRDTRSAGPAAQKNVAVTLLDEARNPVRTWLLRGCFPMKYSGPTLAGKGGGDVAMEEIVLSVEGFEIQS